MATLLSDGLIFSISPPCKRQNRSKDENDESSNVMVILAPFNKIPKINFGQVKINKEVTRNLLIVNPQEFSLNLLVTSESLNLNKLEINIDKKTTINFKLIWRPTKVDKYTFKINIDLKNSRLKFQINAFGECIDEPKRTKTRQKPTILQPVRENTNPIRRETFVLNSNNANNATQISEIFCIDEDAGCNITRTHSMQSICNETPRFSDFNHTRKIESRILNSTVIKTTMIEKHEQKFDQTITYSTINVENEYIRKNYLYQHSSDEDEDGEDVKVRKIEKKKLKAAAVIQKWVKTMKERIKFLRERRLIKSVQRKWREKHEKRVKAAKVIQKWTRSMTQRYAYLKQRRAICTIQQKWRQKYERRVQAVTKIQIWSRSMHQRYLYLQQYHAVCLVQKLWRIQLCRRLQAAIKIQKWTRTMKQRYLYLQKKQAAFKIQNWTRSLKQRYIYLQQYHAVCLVQQLWRIQLSRRLHAAITIQRWTRSMSQRYTYLKQYHAICTVQQVWRQKYKKRVEAAIIVQKWTRSMKQRYVYLHQYRAICKVQETWRKIYEKRVVAAIKIQNWARNMKTRFDYLHKRRLTCKIQQIWRNRFKKRTLAATCIQRHWRLHQARVELKEKSALLIQNKWRSYKTRQLKCEIWLNTVRNHIKLVHLTKLIYIKREILSINIKLKQVQRENQAANIIKRCWRVYKFRKSLKQAQENRYALAALKIQVAYRQFKLRQIESAMEDLLNNSATIIQSFWRGYKTRKLKSIKITQQTPDSARIQKSTIGERFKYLLSTFQSHNATSLSISQLVAILIELSNLTSVSYECCFSFIHSSSVDTIDLIFRFIQSCNRSQPHIDLLNICLKLLLNLLKCKPTFKHVVHKLTFKASRIEQLVGLLKSFYLNNCQLFVNSSILLMILALNNEGCMRYLKNNESLKVLMKLKELISKRSNLKLVNLSENYCKRAVTNKNAKDDDMNEPMLTINNNNAVVAILKLNFKKPADSLNYLLVNVLKCKI